MKYAVARVMLETKPVEYIYHCPNCKLRFEDWAGDIDDWTWPDEVPEKRTHDFECPDCGVTVYVRYPLIKPERGPFLGDLSKC